MINLFLNKYRQYNKEKYFKAGLGFLYKYAFIGTGSHARTQLYPLLQYFGVPLKYIFSKNQKNSTAQAAIYKNAQSAESLEVILNDKEIKAAFVCVNANEHFRIVKQLLQAGKHVFVEKPPCQTLEQLYEIETYATRLHVSLQQRYAPAIHLLKKEANKAKFYFIQYTTGAFPEGDALTELFIHPLDIALHLFGAVKNSSAVKIKMGSSVSYQLQVEHNNGISGQLLLSTAYSWNTANEQIEIHSGAYATCCQFPGLVKKTKIPAAIAGIPLEKIYAMPAEEQVLLNGHNMATGISNHSSYLHGFYGSVQTFLYTVEKGGNPQLFSQLKELYKWLQYLQTL